MKYFESSSQIPEFCLSQHKGGCSTEAGSLHGSPRCSTAAAAAAWPHVEQTAGLLTSRNSPHQPAHSALRFHTFGIYSCSECSWRRSTLLPKSLAGDLGTQGLVCGTLWRHALVYRATRWRRSCYSVCLLFNRVGKPIIPFSDQASDLI